VDGIRIAFLLFPNVTQLDLTGPAQVMSRIGQANIELVAKTNHPVVTDSGFNLTPTATFATLTDCHILCVPGGMGVQDAMEDEDTIAWVRHVAGRATWVTSVCTGSLLLGAAGLLQGYRATTHWTSHHLLAAFGAIPVKQRVVFDRNRVTGGGVTAGIDFGLALVAAIRGEEHARFVQLSLEYNPEPPFDAGSPETAGEATMARYAKIAFTSAGDREARTLAAASRMRIGDTQLLWRSGDTTLGMPEFRGHNT